MLRIVAKCTGAGLSSHGALGTSQLNVKNPNILVVALEFNIVMAVGSNLHAFTMVLLTPVITAAKLTLTLKHQGDLPDLAGHVGTDLFQSSAVGLNTGSSRNGFGHTGDSSTKGGGSQTNRSTVGTEESGREAICEVQGTPILTDNGTDLVELSRATTRASNNARLKPKECLWLEPKKLETIHFWYGMNGRTRPTIFAVK